jgi:hypothetical protein
MKKVEKKESNDLIKSSDLKRIVFKKDLAPFEVGMRNEDETIYFTLRPLSKNQFHYLSSISKNLAELNKYVFRFATIDCRDVIDISGEPVKLEFEEFEVLGVKEKLLTENMYEWFDSIIISKLIDEVLKESRLDFNEKMNIELFRSKPN